MIKKCNIFQVISNLINVSDSFSVCSEIQIVIPSACYILPMQDVQVSGTLGVCNEK